VYVKAYASGYLWNLSVEQINTKYITATSSNCGNILKPSILPMDGNIPLGTSAKVDKIMCLSTHKGIVKN
jgi:hypothetical protein